MAGSSVDPAQLRRVCAIAEEHADEVDASARVPSEAIEAMRAEHLLSCSLPESVGGQGAGIADLSRIARSLGAACSSAGMIFAMHHSQALVLARYADEEGVRDLARPIAQSESLLASATTEIGTGGDVGSSLCSLIPVADRIRVVKNAPVVSYAEAADYIFTTARRTADSPANDQVLVVAPKGDISLTQTSTWDVMGFRGTASPGFKMQIDTDASHVLPVDYTTISATTMLPASHTLWSSVWLGLADAAVATARAAVRKSARGDTASPAALRLADLVGLHQRFQATVADGVGRFQALFDGHFEPTVGFTLAMNNLKIASSLQVVEVVTAALAVVGINGYREDHPSSMSRLVRDCFAPQLMVSNERIRQNNAQLALVAKGTQ